MPGLRRSPSPRPRASPFVQIPIPRRNTARTTNNYHDAINGNEYYDEQESGNELDDIMDAGAIDARIGNNANGIGDNQEAEGEIDDTNENRNDRSPLGWHARGRLIMNGDFGIHRRRVWRRQEVRDFTRFMWEYNTERWRNGRGRSTGRGPGSRRSFRRTPYVLYIPRLDTRHETENHGITSQNRGGESRYNGLTENNNDGRTPSRQFEFGTGSRRFDLMCLYVLQHQSRRMDEWLRHELRNCRDEFRGVEMMPERPEFRWLMSLREFTLEYFDIQLRENINAYSRIWEEIDESERILFPNGVRVGNQRDYTPPHQTSTRQFPDRTENEQTSGAEILGPLDRERDAFPSDGRPAGRHNSRTRRLGTEFRTVSDIEGGVRDDQQGSSSLGSRDSGGTEEESTMERIGNAMSSLRRQNEISSNLISFLDEELQAATAPDGPLQHISGRDVAHGNRGNENVGEDSGV